MTPEDQKRLAEAEAALAVAEVEIRHITADLAEMKADIKAVRAFMSEARGSWKMLFAIAGLSSLVGALAHKVFNFVGGN